MNEPEIDVFEISEKTTPPCVFVQYATDVRSFSSQYGSEISISYTAYNICGKPSKYPAYGDFPQTFVMRTYGKWWDEAPSRRTPIMPQNERKVKSQDYIDIIFDQMVIPTEVSIYETYHPGSVVRIWSTDGEEKWSMLWEGEPQTKDHLSNIFSPPIKKIDYYTNILRIEFNHSNLDYYTEIDAVRLTGTQEYVKIVQESNIFKNLEDEVRLMYLLDGNGDEPSQSLSDKGQPTSKLEVSRDFCETNDGQLSVLPDETILKIFSYLDLLSLRKSSMVNRHFYHLANDPMLYTELNLKPYWNIMTARSLCMLSTKCSFLQKIDLSWCGSFPTTISPELFCKFIETHGQHLTHLLLDCCQFVSDCCIKTISKYCLNIKELTMQNCVFVSENGFKFLSKVTTLERLDLYRTLIEASSLKEILISSPNMKHLNLGSCRRISSMDEIAQVLGTYNNKLISVDFWKTYSLTPIGIKHLSKCSALEEIDIGWCLGVSIPGNCFFSLAIGCPRLRKLFMGTLRGITDRDLYPFIDNCPNLEQIDLLGNRGITADVCLTILKSCKRLRFLEVSFCDQISDTQVQKWRNEFPRVDIKRSFQSEPECSCAFVNHY